MSYGAYVKSYGGSLGRYKGGNYKTKATRDQETADFRRRAEEQVKRDNARVNELGYKK